MKPNKAVKQIFIIGLLLLALSLAGCSWGGGTPQVAVSPVDYDFGQIGPDPVTTTFTVSNQGDGPLQIESVTTSCGCTTAQISNQTITPGASASLIVTFNPQAHAGTAGQFVRYVYLRTNDPATPKVEVEIRADVIEKPIAEASSRGSTRGEVSQ